jgi:uncharacterized protein (TIGR00266 family)
MGRPRGETGLDDSGVPLDGRQCSGCGASSPAASPTCIVCGLSLAGPFVYKIIGTTMPALEIALEPGQSVYAQTGRLGWMTESVQMSTVLAASPWAMLGRVVSGMTPLVAQFAATLEPGVVALTCRLPGHILPLDVALDRSYILQSGAFMAAQDSVTVSPYFNRNLGAAFFGGEGFILQRLHGAGMAFAQIDGELVQRELAPMEVLLVDPGSVAVFESSVGFSLRLVKGISNILFNEGLFLAELRGPGTIWLQTMPFSNLVGSIAAQLPTLRGGGSPQTQVAGSIGNIIGGVLGG